MKAYAEYALHQVDAIVQLGARRELPTHVELEACKRLQPVTVRVNFLDTKVGDPSVRMLALVDPSRYSLHRQYVMMPVNSWTTAEQFNEMLAIRLGIKDNKPFSVYEVHESNLARASSVIV